MKDHIFIGWSGSNAIAMKVKNALEAKNFRCTIGGNADNNSQYSSVGDTVIQQIKSCNQAIITREEASCWKLGRWASKQQFVL